MIACIYITSRKVAKMIFIIYKVELNTKKIKQITKLYFNIIKK